LFVHAGAAQRAVLRSLGLPNYCAGRRAPFRVMIGASFGCSQCDLRRALIAHSHDALLDGSSIRPGSLLVEDVCCSWRLLALTRGCSVARSGFTAPGPRVGGPELRSPRVDVWDEAVQFLLIGDRARQLAERHPLTADGCSSCARPGCVAARMAVEALELGRATK